jgi:hypothetical protein
METSESEQHFKKSTFGTCAYNITTPPRENLTANTKIINVILPFEEALKLNLAIDECIRRLNRYNKAKKVGKRVALNLAIHLDQSRVSVHEGKMNV